MDFNEFWQENKRWLLGCLAGVLVFLIARSIVDGRFNAPARSDASKANGIYKKFRKQGPENEFYVGSHEAKAKADAKRLSERLATLREAMHYEMAPEYDLEGKGDAELHRAAVYSKVRERVFEAAARYNVEFPEDGFAWQPPTERELLQRELVGISLVDHFVKQLMEAHKTVTEADFAALGVHAITSFKMDRARKVTRRSFRRDPKVQAADLLSEVGVKFQFEADNRTAHQFFENCRASRPRVVLAGLTILRGRRSGDPLSVRGEVRALSIQPLPSEEEGG